MDAEEAIQRVRAKLASILDRKGAVLFSGVDTLTSGTLYVMGFNPGGDPDPVAGDGPSDDGTIGASLGARRENWNSWVDERYAESGGLSPLQSRIKSVFEALDANPRRTFSTNAVFVRSKGASDLSDRWALWWQDCWPVHQLLLSIVRPRVVVCLGNGDGDSAWNMLRHTSPKTAGTGRYRKSWEDAAGSSAAGKWREGVEFDLGDHGGHLCAVLGLPHPSGRNVTEWPLSEEALAKVELAKAAAGRSG